MKTILKIILPLFIILSACSPQKRLQHLLVTHPELKNPDTLLIRDTLIQPGCSIDTVVTTKDLRDTVILTKDNLLIRLQTRHDTLVVQGECKADTIVKTLKIPVEKIREIKPDKTASFIAKIPWIVIGLITITAALIYFFRK